MVSKSKVIIINMIVFLTLVVVLELFLLGLRIFLGHVPLGFMYSDSPIDVCGMKTNTVLSHTHNLKENCIILGGESDEHFVYYESNSDNDIIITLGGSTTSGFYQHYSDGFTYPLVLNDLVK